MKKFGINIVLFVGFGVYKKMLRRIHTYFFKGTRQYNDDNDINE